MPRRQEGPRQRRDASALRQKGARPPRRAKRGGRPTELTPTVQWRILAALRKGHFFKHACELAGVPEKTGAEWVRRGEGDDERPATEPYATFATLVRKARIQALDHHLSKIHAGETPDSRWYLERAFHEDYGRRDAVAVQNPDGSALAQPLVDGILRLVATGQPPAHEAPG
jgi:hypothetical protein